MPIDYKDPATSSAHRSHFLLHRRKFILSPEQWETISNQFDNFNWKEIQFKSSNKNLISEVEGLYLFVASPKKVNAGFLNYLFYVGESQNLRKRFQDYIDKIDNPKSQQYKVQQLINDYNENLYFYYVELRGFNVTQRREIEDKFLTAFLPPVNSKYPQGLQGIVQGAYQQ